MTPEQYQGLVDVLNVVNQNIQLTNILLCLILGGQTLMAFIRGRHGKDLF